MSSMPGTPTQKPTKKAAKTKEKQEKEQPPEEMRVKERFFDTLVEQCLAQVDLDGLAGEVARLVAPQIGRAVSVEKLAADLADRHREELAAALSTAITASLIGQR